MTDDKFLEIVKNLRFAEASDDLSNLVVRHKREHEINVEVSCLNCKQNVWEKTNNGFVCWNCGRIDCNGINMTDEEIKAECERRFQAGESRTQLLKAHRYGVTFRQLPSVKDAQLLRDEGDRIFVRRKVPYATRYEWKEIK